MNVKNTITLSDRYMRYAEQQVEDGQFPSVEKVVEAGLDELMRSGDGMTQEHHDAVTAMANEINRRLDGPRDKWISMEEDNLFDRVRARIADRQQAK
ncbi:hypothetical protein GAO09_16615 [Rhizobiales bacterium RZME27]|jgi:antitoxin ParD1/3/4|uniref:Type II toxin-antitoxin system ParD family antitoxin n=1 Tax=Endobacterium cereale TaxID=2663029 RepID=A0A6A8AD60_9HYPH|nr:hypothetical protein [Endobacterium cereale]MEB2846921.1 hypothetical protein [Endobacterium cereale]MQY47660.1 hypothetical protein [Endobacterium cereale]